MLQDSIKELNFSHLVLHFMFFFLFDLVLQTPSHWHYRWRLAKRNESIFWSFNSNKHGG